MKLSILSNDLSKGALYQLLFSAVVEASERDMPDSAPLALKKILEAEEFARHRKVSFWEETRTALWEYLQRAYQSFADWLQVKMPAAHAWLPSWIADLGSFIESVLLAVFRASVWLLNALYYPILILLAAIAVLLIARYFIAREKGEGPIPVVPKPAEESLDALRARGDPLTLLEALRRQVRSSLGHPDSTDRELIIHTVSPPSVASAIFEYFEKVAYAGQNASETVVFSLYDRYLQEGR